MADEKTRKSGAPERFELGASYDEIGPDLGSLHDAWQVDTGEAALHFQPGDRVEWQLSGDYEVSLSCRRGSSIVRLRVKEGPRSVRTSELADICMWMHAALQRVEHNPRVSAHLTRPPSPSHPPTSISRSPCTPAVLALMAVLSWLHLTREPELPSPAPAGALSDVHAPADAPYVTDSDPPSPPSLAYPLPSKPFRNQAAAPCKPELWEEEINGGCWMQLGRPPPCLKIHAEYQGKCYLPVSKDRGRLPSTVQP
ncbi:hypothetical protein [Melittangium boletus]|uniref:Uncharacterized protein n=1 Tax=Melittangium boletus DSM 14713 TaxID=1294270 RepID=A0A250IDU2_9BACT|nr:hypothetical protein [Melittangium boletus]ATB30024.1 hypothetical protein MEBOL_003479 [Melittangium boletus DSM 14713]